MKLILKSFCTAMVLLIMHGAYVYANRLSGIAQNQRQQNIIKAQHFVYNDYHTADYVLLGSSLTYRLKGLSDHGFYNLAFIGGSIYDGLELLSRQEKTPKCVLVEMNYFSRKPKEQFIESIYNPLFKVRKYYEPLRDEFQPAGLFSNALSIRWLNSIVSELKPERDSGYHRNKDTIIFQKLLNARILEYKQNIPADLAQTNLALLDQYVSALRANGCKVIFFEMPVDSHLDDLPFAIDTRKMLRNQFPEPEYEYIRVPDSLSFSTQDGIHLNDASAAKMCWLINSAVQPLIP